MRSDQDRSVCVLSQRICKVYYIECNCLFYLRGAFQKKSANFGFWLNLCWSPLPSELEPLNRIFFWKIVYCQAQLQLQLQLELRLALSPINPTTHLPTHLTEKVFSAALVNINLINHNLNPSLNLNPISTSTPTSTPTSTSTPSQPQPQPQLQVNLSLAQLQPQLANSILLCS